jgi:hypothetical protein
MAEKEEQRNIGGVGRVRGDQIEFFVWFRYNKACNELFT